MASGGIAARENAAVTATCRKLSPANECLARYGEVVESRQRGESARPCPTTDTAPPNEGYQYGNEYHAESGDKRGFRCSRFGNPNGLKCVAAKHENPDPHSRPKIRGRKLAKVRAIEPRHWR